MDSKLTTTVTQALQITSVESGAERAVTSEFVYDPADPYAVSLLLQNPNGIVGWSFARELLLGGIYEPTGDGDVCVWPCLGSRGEAVVIVELHNDTDTTLLQFPTRQVSRFLEATLDAVPAGAETEHVDLDSWLDELLP